MSAVFGVFNMVGLMWDTSRGFWCRILEFAVGSGLGVGSGEHMVLGVGSGVYMVCRVVLGFGFSFW